MYLPTFLKPYRLTFTDGNPSGGAGGGSGSGGQGGSTDPSAGTLKTEIKSIEDIPKELYQEIFNKAVKVGKDKADKLVEQKLIELGYTDEKVEKWKRLEKAEQEAEEKNLAKKGEFDKLKEQLVEAHKVEMGNKEKALADLKTEKGNVEKALDKEIIEREIVSAGVKFDAYDVEQLVQLTSSMFVRDQQNGKQIAVHKINDEVQVDKDGNPKTVEAVIQEYLNKHPNQVKSKISGLGSGARGAFGKQGQQDRKNMTGEQAISAGLGAKSKFTSDRNLAPDN